MNEYYKLYVSAELNYISRNKTKTLDELFPSGWYEIKDYDFKTKVIIDSIKNNILIKDSELYNGRMMLHL